MLRGINQQRIFEEKADYLRFVEIMRDTKDASKCGLLAWCLMSNHVHLLLATDGEVDSAEYSSIQILSRFFLQLETRYAQWFNKKYERSGHLFTNRYKSEVVQDNAYLLTVIDYIHQNPVVAGLCEKSKDYPWSSRQSLGKGKGLVDEVRLFQMISLDDALALDARQDTGQDKPAPFREQRGRRLKVSDDEAVKLIENISGVATTAKVLSLSSDKQFDVVCTLRKHYLSLRQIARLTGLSKGVVERWEKKRKQE
jgi:REP element-mobilizing transposase RayT/DNA-binding transcriptional regulator YiaG